MILALLLCLNLETFSQTVLKWEQTYRIPGNTELLTSAAVEVPGGYVLAGEMGIDYIPGFPAMVRVDLFGDTVWTRQIDFPASVRIHDLITTQDGGLLMAGSVGNNGLFIKTNTAGDTLWTQRFAEPSASSFSINSVIELPDQGLMCTGTLLYDYEAMVIRTDSLGNEVWRQIYDHYPYVVPNEIIAASDGNFVIAGTGQKPGGTAYAPFILKLDTLGDTLWSSIGGNANYEEFNTVVETPDSGYVLGGQELISWSRSVSFIKFNIDGDSLWQKSYSLEGTGYAQSVFSIDNTLDGNLIASGDVWPAAATYPDTSDIFIMKLDQAGDTLWNTYHNSNEIDRSRCVFPTQDGGYMIAGYQNLDLYQTRGYLLKVGINGFATANNHFQGEIYTDFNGNCVRDPGENGAPGWLLKAWGPGSDIYGFSDTGGSYSLGTNIGTYSLSVTPSSPYWEVSSCATDTFSYTFLGDYETVYHDFPVTPKVLCPDLMVDISTPVLRFCTPSFYQIDYCNSGTAAEDSARIEVIIDTLLTVTGSTFPWELPQVGNLYLFNIGHLDLLECGSITLDVDVSCHPDNMNRTACVEAHILPEYYCLPEDPTWDSAEVALSIICLPPDSVQFTLSNIGTGNMLTPSGWSVVEDNILRMQGSILLNAGADTSFTLFSPGSSWNLEAQQSPGYPGNSHPSVFIEGCGTDPLGGISLGFLAGYPQDDARGHLSIDCRIIMGPYDPNDKTGYPTGMGPDHMIPNDQEIEYVIRFQNVGADTAFRVLITDEISPLLDLSSLVMQSASHPYSLEIENGNILKWTFDNINLPDSTTDFAGSNGFVKFRIAQQTGLADGTVIENTAEIYFDYNPAVITNTWFHTLGENFLITYVPAPAPEKSQVKIYPNPMREEATIELGTEAVPDLSLTLMDLTGRIVHTESWPLANRITLRREGLSDGIYLFSLTSRGEKIGTGKVVVK